MIGHIREEQMALYASGDLDARQHGAIADHIEGCGECRKTLDEFREAASFLAAALREPELEDLVQVREAVAAKLQQSRGGERRWTWWLTGAAVASLLTVALNVGHRATVMRTMEPLIAVSVPQPKIAPAIQTAPKAALVRRARTVRHAEAGLRGVTLIAGAHQVPTLKMTTDDPNVVILWQMNEGTKVE